MRLVLFDIDGTLIHSGGAGVRAFGRTFETLFNIPDSTRLVRFAGRTDTSILREMMTLHRVPASAESVARFFDTYTFWLDHFLHQLNGGSLPGVLRLIERFRQLQRPPLIGLLTGNIRLGAELKLRRYELWQQFETGAFGSDHEDRNQLAEIARQRASSHLGAPLAGSEVLVIGDTPRDIECARAIGARVLAVATGDCPLESLREHTPDHLAASLEDVSAAELCR